MPILDCKICHKNFYQYPSRVKMGSRYCSTICFGISIYKRKEAKCSNCGKILMVEPNRILRKNIFCDRKCADEWKHNYWKKIDKKAKDDCWNWLGYKDRDGYGKFRRKGMGSPEGIHRLVYKELICEIPKDKQLDHLCRNRACVNPNHLEIVTVRENVLRGNGLASMNAKKTHCVRGHKFSESNTEWRTPTKRRCIVCRRMEYAKKMDKLKNNFPTQSCPLIV